MTTVEDVRLLLIEILSTFPENEPTTLESVKKTKLAFEALQGLSETAEDALLDVCEKQWPPTESDVCTCGAVRSDHHFRHAFQKSYASLLN